MTREEKRTGLAAAILAAAGVALMALRILGMRFSGCLLLGIAAWLVLWLLLKRWGRRSSAGKWCLRIYIAGTLAIVTLLGSLEGTILLRSTGMPAISAEAVVILGAGVNGTEPSLSLRTRLDAALDYLETHPEIPVVLTGGQGYGEEISEARCMYEYLTARGVEPERLILEERAENTAENFAFSKPLLAAEGVDVENALVAVVTNDFHIYRAIVLAGRQGYGYAFGVAAELPWLHLEVNYYLREAFAMVKTLLLDR